MYALVYELSWMNKDGHEHISNMDPQPQHDKNEWSTYYIKYCIIIITLLVHNPVDLYIHSPYAFMA
jgi:hypothetical protein